MFKKLAPLALALLLTLALSGIAFAQEYNYVSAQQVADIIKNSDAGWVLIDIQPQSNFEKNHLQNAIPTYAFPVDTPELEAKLMEGANQAGDRNIVIVCPGGKTGAINSVNYLRTQGFADDRLYILEKGQNGWPNSLKEYLDN